MSDVGVKPRAAENEACPFISIVIPHLNQPESLKLCFRSLARQTLARDRFEVIVVDNGSDVLPEDTVASFEEAQLELEARPGPGPARNKGVSVARGSVLAFIDADCTADPHWLEAINAFFQTAPERTVIGGDVRIAMTDHRHPTMLEAYESVFAYRQREYIEKLGFSGTGNLAMRLSEFQAVGPFAGIEVAEDRDWGRRAIAKGCGVVYVPEMVIYHPARKSLGELTEKLRRHTLHDLAEWRNAGRGTATWLMRAAAVGLSPLAHWLKPLTSSRISGIRARVEAIWVLVYTRVYRCWWMLIAVGSNNGARTELRWNKPTGKSGQV